MVTLYELTTLFGVAVFQAAGTVLILAEHRAGTLLWNNQDQLIPRGE